MSNLADLLPSNSGVFEKAIAASLSDTLEVPYAEIMDPYATDAKWLPWLAVQNGLDLWFDDWPDEKKREAIAQAAGRSVLVDGELNAFKTMRTGAKRYLALVDAQIVDAVSYPAYAFSDDAFCDHAVLDHAPFLASYLVKVDVFEPAASFVDEAFADDGFAGDTNTEQEDRCLTALGVAKGPDTEIRVDFQNYRVITAGDGFTANDGLKAGQHVMRSRL